LILLNHSRRAARFRGNELILLDDQDHSLWDEAQIAEARQLLERALALQCAGAYVVQAAIADLHVQEPRDWDQIALLYRQLEELTGSPIVTVNRAVALAQLEGPEAALALLDGLDLDGYVYFHSTRADFLRRLGRDDEAQAAYGRALEIAETEPERRFLQSRLHELRPPPAGS
jgi:RNA polymerase sigma-70 factor, ECF subfamily